MYIFDMTNMTSQSQIPGYRVTGGSYTGMKVAGKEEINTINFTTVVSHLARSDTPNIT